MLSSGFVSESLVIASTGALAPVIFAVDPDLAFQVIPVGSGLGGALVCALVKANQRRDSGQKPPAGGTFAFITIVLAGSVATIGGSPAILEALGWRSIPTAMGLHLVVGLTGSAICDAVISAGPKIGTWLVEAARRAIGLDK